MVSPAPVRFRPVLRALLALAAVAGASLGFGPSAAAQYYGGYAPIPTACDMTAASVTYGPLSVGSQVQLAAHTPWRGDANWSPDMGRYVGLVATITSLEGVDSVGCPVVRVSADAGQYFWRIRDMSWAQPTQPPPPPPPPTGDLIPRYCGMTASSAQFGAVRPGIAVVLGAHTYAGPGDDLNWNGEMARWAGLQTTVSSLEGVDDYGCPVVRVAADGGRFFWRIRDMQLVSGYAPTPPVASVPTWCGMSPGTVQWGPVRPGSWVVLGMHTSDVGDPNWAPEMSRYVGQQTTITELVGTDSQGCPVVRVAVDGGSFSWRIRNMTFVR